MRTSFLILLAALATASVAPARLGAQTGQPGLEFFERKIRPLLADNCYSCHGEEKQKGGLRLDSPGAIRAGGESGPILVAGNPSDSRIILAVSYQNEDLKMPPKKRLSAPQVADLTEWVKSGATMPADNSTNSPAPARKDFQITDKDRGHWSFQPLKRPATPQLIKPGVLASNPIDAFILSQLQTKGLTPNPQATRTELIRRAYFDLTGLPPSPEEVEAFVADTSPQAWEKLIDRLLDSPRYGEKWGRHWLDLVRFAESNSYENDQPKPHAWRFRDYVIRSFNSDKPYDQFVREQLAGDELPNADAESIVATGFYRLGIWDSESPDKELARYDSLDDMVATTGQVFLGLTVDCARCHHHKQDPISQADYYRLLSFFENVTPYQVNGAAIEVSLPGRPDEKALAVTENGTTAPDTFVLIRGNPKVKGEKVIPGFLQVLGAQEAHPIPLTPDAKTTRRRTQLAQWIASSDNPLTARVMANRIWQHHFGRGLVRSPNNFGLQGDAPTHPELLNWLASEFVAQGWRLKPLHRLIMTSQTYQMSSRGNAQALRVDPANDHLWRFDMRRLAAEEIRDSILAINGSLQLKMYGPGVYVDIPKEVMAGQSRPGDGWGKSPPEEQARRSIYIYVKRSLLTPILESFDLAETDRSTAVRFSTVQPTQALGLINSTFMNRQAEILAERLKREVGNDVPSQVRRALYLVTSRPPTDSEVSHGMKLMESLREKDQATADAALNQFCLMALNLNEMVFID